MVAEEFLNETFEGNIVEVDFLPSQNMVDAGSVDVDPVDGIKGNTWEKVASTGFPQDALHLFRLDLFGVAGKEIPKPFCGF